MSLSSHPRSNEQKTWAKTPAPPTSRTRNLARVDSISDLTEYKRYSDSNGIISNIPALEELAMGVDEILRKLDQRPNDHCFQCRLHLFSSCLLPARSSTTEA
jgi:hypothetical protein